MAISAGQKALAPACKSRGTWQRRRRQQLPSAATAPHTPELAIHHLEVSVCGSRRASPLFEGSLQKRGVGFGGWMRASDRPRHEVDVAALARAVRRRRGARVALQITLPAGLAPVSRAAGLCLCDRQVGGALGAAGALEEAAVWALLAGAAAPCWALGRARNSGLRHACTLLEHCTTLQSLPHALPPRRHCCTERRHSSVEPAAAPAPLWRQLAAC